jgi:hypothetical protein
VFLDRRRYDTCVIVPHVILVHTLPALLPITARKLVLFIIHAGCAHTLHCPWFASGLTHSLHFTAHHTTRRSALFLAILLACMHTSFKAGSLPQDMACYSALVVSHLLLAVASTRGTPTHLDVAAIASYVMRATACALCGLGLYACEFHEMLLC